MAPTDPYPMKTLSSLELSGTNGHAAAPVPATAPVETPLPPALSAPPNLEAAWHILRRRWPLVVCLGLVAAILGAAVGWYVAPGKYSANAVIHLESRNPRTESIEPEEFLNFQRTQTATLKSNEVLKRLIARQEILELSEMQKHQGSELEWLQKDLVTDILMGPELLRVTLTGDNPDDLAKILNALVAIFKETSDAEEQSKVDHQIDRLGKSIEETTDKDMKPGPGAPDRLGGDLRTLEWKQQDLQQTITTLQIKLGQAQLEIRKNEVEKADFERKRAKPADLVKELDVLEKVDQDDEIRPLRLERTQLNREMLDYQRKAPNSTAKEERLEEYRRKIVNLDKEIDALRARNSDEIRKALQEKEMQKLKSAISDLDTKITLLKKEEEAAKQDLSVATQAIADVRLQIYKKAGRASETTRALLTAELSKWTASKSAPSRVEVKERAQVPTARQLDKKMKFAGGAALGMFGLVALGVFLTEFRERRVYSQQDVARGLGLRVIGTLPYQSSRGKATEAEQFAMLESSDALRTVLLQAGRNDGVRVLMITSAGTGEGKTSLACQLAASLGRAGRRTLLIDGDLRNPAAHTQFSVPLTPGFAEALRGEIDPDDAIKPTSVANLSLLPAGQCDLAAIQALAQDELQTLFYTLKEDYEFVILDASPVLPVADALVIGQHADAVLFSVLRDVSKLPQVYEAQQRLAALGIRMLGAVVSGEKARTYGNRVLVTAKK